MNIVYAATRNLYDPMKVAIRYNDSFCCGHVDNPAVVHFAGFPDWFINPYIPRREYLERYL